MKITPKQGALLRFGIWIAGLTWAVLFLTFMLFIYSPLIKPKVVEIYGEGFPLWVFPLFYVLSIVAVVLIFLWLFRRFLRRK